MQSLLYETECFFMVWMDCLVLSYGQNLYLRFLSSLFCKNTEICQKNNYHLSKKLVKEVPGKSEMEGTWVHGVMWSPE